MQLGGSTVVMVTGASRGIGRATARAFADRGCSLALVARSGDELERLVGELGVRALALPADVSQRADVRHAVERTVSELGGLDVVVANAGVAHYEYLLDQDPADADAMVAVNVAGTLHTVHEALGPMAERGRGHVVVVSSGAGLRAFPQAAVYGATKAFGRGLGEALRHELSGTGISLTTVYPGEVETSLHDHERERLPDWRRNDSELPAERLAREIVLAVERDRRELHLPWPVRLLGLNGIAPRLVDRTLRAIRDPSAAPRRD